MNLKDFLSQIFTLTLIGLIIWTSYRLIETSIFLTITTVILLIPTAIVFLLISQALLELISTKIKFLRIKKSIDWRPFNRNDFDPIFWSIKFSNQTASAFLLDLGYDSIEIKGQITLPTKLSGEIEQIKTSMIDDYKKYNYKT